MTVEADWRKVALRAKGFLADEEGLALYAAAGLAGREVGGPIVEIGTYCAKSTVYLAAAAAACGSLVFSIDHHRGSEELQEGWEYHDHSVVDVRTGRIDTLPHARRTLEEAGLESSTVLIVGDSVAVGSAWGTAAAMVFIDGGHSAKIAWDDYNTWVPKIAPGGLLAIHDVFENPEEGGRPPYELYVAALESGDFSELKELAVGSLRVLRKTEL